MSHAEFRDRLLQDERRRAEAHDYGDYHRERFEYVIAACRRLRPDPGARVLDIGRSHLSLRLAEHYDRVSTLGLPLSDADPIGPDASALADHVVCDLNEAAHTGLAGTDERYDLIVFAEVLEHLHSAPELVLRLLRGLLADGGLLLCQTPNAAALSRRLRLLAGRHPYERIRIDRENPGHFREYTRDELLEIARTAGLTVREHRYADYFAAPAGVAGRLAVEAMRLAGRVQPSLLRGQTAVFVRV